jgi:hypothetical protein
VLDCARRLDGARVGYCWGVGAWRSLVARAVRVGEVPGSNPGAPIAFKNREYPRIPAKGPETPEAAKAVFAGIRGCSRGLGPQRDRRSGRNGPQMDRKRPRGANPLAVGFGARAHCSCFDFSGPTPISSALLAPRAIRCLVL